MKELACGGESSPARPAGRHGFCSARKMRRFSSRSGKNHDGRGQWERKFSLMWKASKPVYFIILAHYTLYLRSLMSIWQEMRTVVINQQIRNDIFFHPSYRVHDQIGWRKCLVSKNKMWLITIEKCFHCVCADTIKSCDSSHVGPMWLTTVQSDHSFYLLGEMVQGPCTTLYIRTTPLYWWSLP